ncbi:MAG: YdgA family protein [Azoarcus sp.]|jgi:uncharacterized protein YdgA (DUF945 family)|nr:YdgA family protein [Azoarcus sp.]
MKVGAAGKIVGVIAVLTVVVYASSYWVGSQIEERFRERVDRASGQGFRISTVDYQRGIFGATARTDVTFQSYSDEDSSETETVTVPVIHSIRHGPFSALFGAVRIHSEVQLSQLKEDSIEQLDEFFDGAPPSFPELDTVIGWTGGLSLQITLPKAEKFRFRRMSDNGVVRNIELENVRATVDVSMKDDLLDTGVVKFDAGKIAMEGGMKETIENLSLTVQLENIDIFQVLDNPWQAIMDIIGEQGQTAAPWLQRKPAITIKDARGRWPEGMVTGSFRIAYVGDGNPNPDPDAQLRNITGDLKMELPRALAIRHMSLQVSEAIADDTLEEGEDNDVDIEQETKKQVDKQMDGMLKDGIFVEKGDTLSVDAHLQNGNLHLNGKDQPVEKLFELIPPSL